MKAVLRRLSTLLKSTTVGDGCRWINCAIDLRAALEASVLMNAVVIHHQRGVNLDAKHHRPWKTWNEAIKMSSSTLTPALAARCAVRTISSRRTSPPPAWKRRGGSEERSAMTGEA